MRFELMTSSLPRKRSTPELHWRSLSGRRGSNPRPLAWKANALPTELLPLFSFLLKYPALDSFKFCGRRWIRTTEGINQQIYSLPHLATLVFSRFFVSFGRLRCQTLHRRSVIYTSKLLSSSLVFLESIPKQTSKFIFRMSSLSDFDLSETFSKN